MVHVCTGVPGQSQRLFTATLLGTLFGVSLPLEHLMCQGAVP